jgi:hypothetical protein
LAEAEKFFLVADCRNYVANQRDVRSPPAAASWPTSAANRDKMLALRDNERSVALSVA